MNYAVVAIPIVHGLEECSLVVAGSGDRASAPYLRCLLMSQQWLDVGYYPGDVHLWWKEQD